MDLLSWFGKTRLYLSERSSGAGLTKIKKCECSLMSVPIFHRKSLVFETGGGGNTYRSTLWRRHFRYAFQRCTRPRIAQSHRWYSSWLEIFKTMSNTVPTITNKWIILIHVALTSVEKVSACLVVPVENLSAGILVASKSLECSEIKVIHKKKKKKKKKKSQ